MALKGRRPVVPIAIGAMVLPIGLMMSWTCIFTACILSICGSALTLEMLRSPLRQTITRNDRANGIALSFGARRGTYRPWWKSIPVTVHGAKSVVRLIADQTHSVTIEIQ